MKAARRLPSCGSRSTELLSAAQMEGAGDPAMGSMVRVLGILLMGAVGTFLALVCACAWFVGRAIYHEMASMRSRHAGLVHRVRSASVLDALLRRHLLVGRRRA